MIKSVSNGTISVNVYQNGPMYGIDVKDGNGLGMCMTIDQFKEFKEMIDFIWGTNDLWRYTSGNDPIPLARM